MLADSNMTFDDSTRPVIPRNEESPIVKEKKIPVSASSSQQLESESEEEGSEDENPSGTDSPSQTPKVQSQRLKNKRLALSKQGSDMKPTRKSSPQIKSSDERSSMSLRSRATPRSDKKRSNQYVYISWSKFLF